MRRQAWGRCSPPHCGTSCGSPTCATASGSPRTCTLPTTGACGWRARRKSSGKMPPHASTMDTLLETWKEHTPMSNTRLSRSQAETLEELNASRPVKVIAVTGGKGGVGKTTISANLAVSIAAQGRDVMLVDADLGLANVDVVLGLNTRFHLGHVVKGECCLEDAIVTGPH